MRISHIDEVTILHRTVCSIEIAPEGQKYIAKIDFFRKLWSDANSQLQAQKVQKRHERLPLKWEASIFYPNPSHSRPLEPEIAHADVLIGAAEVFRSDIQLCHGGTAQST